MKNKLFKIFIGCLLLFGCNDNNISLIGKVGNNIKEQKPNQFIEKHENDYYKALMIILKDTVIFDDLKRIENDTANELKDSLTSVLLSHSQKGEISSQTKELVWLLDTLQQPLMEEENCLRFEEVIFYEQKELNKLLYTLLENTSNSYLKFISEEQRKVLLYDMALYLLKLTDEHCSDVLADYFNTYRIWNSNKKSVLNSSCKIFEGDQNVLNSVIKNLDLILERDNDDCDTCHYAIFIVDSLYPSNSFSVAVELIEHLQIFPPKETKDVYYFPLLKIKYLRKQTIHFSFSSNILPDRVEGLNSYRELTQYVNNKPNTIDIGAIQFSRVYYDKTGNHAVLFAFHMIDHSTSWRFCIFMKKEKGEWKYVDKVTYYCRGLAFRYSGSECDY